MICVLHWERQPGEDAQQQLQYGVVAAAAAMRYDVVLYIDARQ
jgi:hypothetical protein